MVTGKNAIGILEGVKLRHDMVAVTGLTLLLQFL